MLACAWAIVVSAKAQTFSVLHTFQYFPDGALPCTSLYRDANGHFYGTTSGGGSYNAGVVFRLDRAGHQSVLHNFKGGVDGGYSCAGVVMDPAGSLYGRSPVGGTSSVCYHGGPGPV
jgi:uncharacterized repeat protein (TIGR03803 family)